MTETRGMEGSVRGARGVVGDRIIDGQTLPMKFEESKTDVRLLRLVGGQANVDAAEITAWAGSLWHGKRLSYTLVVISLLLAGLCAGIARSFEASS